MTSKWPIARIADCAASEPYSTQIGPFGDKIKATSYVAKGAPVLRGTNLSRHARFHDTDFVYVREELVSTEFAKFICEAGDVILCHKGTLGEIGIIPRQNKYSKYVMGNSMMKVRCNLDILEPLYLYYWLSSKDGQDYLFSRVSQVGVPQIQTPLTTLRQAEFPLPPLIEQKRIASILGSLDDKIELNSKMNETLEQMTKALFKSWFVDFDPVRAKAAGRKPAGMDKATADLFPDSLVDSELGKIPKGWKAASLSHGFQILSGGTPKTSEEGYWNGGIPWYSVKDAPVDSDIWVLSTEKTVTQEGVDNSAAQILPARTTIISARGTVGKLALTGLPMAMNQSCFGLRGKNGISDLTAYFIAQDATIRLLQNTHGTVFDTINRQTFEGVKWQFPPAELSAAFEKQADLLLSKIKTNLEESRTLSALRDTLLPRLLCGDPHLEPID
jgi:restriction endonuclease S subunit